MKKIEKISYPTTSNVDLYTYSITSLVDIFMTVTTKWKLGLNQYFCIVETALSVGAIS